MKIRFSYIGAICWSAVIFSAISAAASGEKPTWVEVLIPTALLCLRSWYDTILDIILDTFVSDEGEENK